MEHIAEQTVQVAGGRDIFLEGNLSVPSDAKGIVLFAHGSGSSRHSPRNQFVARHLEGGGCATLLLDLLHPDEADDRGKVFDIDLLARKEPRQRTQLRVRAAGGQERVILCSRERTEPKSRPRL